MTRCRLLSAAFVGTLIYAAVSIFCGKDGMWASSQMTEQRRILSAHTAEIEKTNEELKLEKVALQYDMDVVASYARKLGLVKDGEKLVKVSGLPARETRIFDPGVVMKHESISYVPEWICKTIGLVAFALVYFLLVVFDAAHGNLKLNTRKKYYNVVKGTPVYEMHEM